MYIFFDTETTGLPRNWNAFVGDLENWPRVVQVAWARYDVQNRSLGTRSFIVKPESFNIPGAAQRIHGISMARALGEGKPLKTVLKELTAAIQESEIVVAHNLRFDENVIGAEFLRQGLDIPFLGKTRICTMIETTDFCRLPGPRGYKWPTLAELHTALFGEHLSKSHDAEADATTCAKCFFELKKRRIFNMGHFK
jgi:DNA polymerase III epsilon subunit-like protein